jgi:hypothetical protein
MVFIAIFLLHVHVQQKKPPRASSFADV